MTDSSDEPDRTAPRDVGVVALLGALAAGELAAFERFSSDAALAPTVADKAGMGALAAAELRHYTLLRDAIADRGADPEPVVERYAEPVRDFHERTRPHDWHEGLMKAYVADGMAADFYREVAGVVDDKARALVLEVLDDTGHARFARERILGAIAADPALSGRLALWGRRLVGEALAQARRVVSADAALAELVADGPSFTGMTENHARRMSALGLSA